MFFSFGKKKRRSNRTKRTKRVGGTRKPPAALLRKCRKHHIKTTKKNGKHRVYRSVALLKKLLRRKMKSHRKVKKTRRVKKTRKVKKHYRRRSRFGEAAPFVQPNDYGYSNKVQQNQGVLSQSSQVVTPDNNINRPPGFGVDPSQLPIYGVYRPFFTENVPTMIGPNGTGFMGQPDGSLYPVGGPFINYTSFGKRRRRRFGNDGRSLSRSNAIKQPTRALTRTGNIQRDRIETPILSRTGRIPRSGNRDKDPDDAYLGRLGKISNENRAASNYYTKKESWPNTFGKRRRSRFGWGS